MSSRAGRTRCARASNSRRRTSSSRARSSRVSGSTRRCRVELPCSKVPAVGHLEGPGRPGARRPGRAPRRAPAVTRRRTCPRRPSLSASSAEANPPSAVPQLAEQELGGLAGDPVAERPTRPARRGRAAGRCRRASSRSAAPPRTRRPSSARSRRRAGRRCRREPSPRGCPAASTGHRDGAGTPAPSTAGTSARSPKPPLTPSYSRSSRFTASASVSSVIAPAAMAVARPRCSRSLPATRWTSSGLVCHASASASSTCRKLGCPCRGWSGK